MEETVVESTENCLKCRLCLHNADFMVSIFGSRGQKAHMSNMLLEHLNLSVKEDEQLPKHICLKCWHTVEYIHSFVQLVEQNQAILANVRDNSNFIVYQSESVLENRKSFEFINDVIESRSSPPSYDEAQKTKLVTQMANEEYEEEVIEIEDEPMYDVVSVRSNDGHATEHIIRDVLPPDDDSNAAIQEEPAQCKDFTSITTQDGESGIVIRVNDYQFPQMIRNGTMIVHGEELDKCLAAYYGLDCELCQQQNWITIEELFKHHRQVHGEQGFINCCGKKMEKKSLMAMHLARHVQPEAFECPICKKMMTTPRILKSHMQNHLPEEEKPYKCKLCPRRFGYVSALLIHASTHREENEEKCVYHLCYSCGRAFRSGGKLAEHIAESHKTDGSSNCTICETCGKTFISKSNLNYHLTTHQPKVLHQVQCEHCGKWLKNKLCLRKHMLQHSQVRHRCDKCDYTTVNMQSLQNHQRVQHTDHKPFECTTCGKCFKLRSNLREHLAQHQKNQKYSCEFCSRRFTSKSNYYCHRKRMHFAELEQQKRQKEQEESAHRMKLKLQQ
ncbi:transcription factor grauzone-like [Anopheles funestus]|uniref:transcription factor grauzone-like n=1 Tax=Anopheles funestus TaxID=62324 RepID=UPI0020C671B2|nr:transcription factor grauzone-like [Anopheles funestus]